MLTLAAIAQGKDAKAAQNAVTELDDALFADQVRRNVPAEFVAEVLAAPTAWCGPERLLDLALRLGPYGDAFGRKPGGLMLDTLAARPDGIDCGALAPRIPEMLRTPSGKIELAPAPLLADLARAVEKLTEPRPDLVMIGRRQLSSNNSWMHNLPLLAKGPDRCTLLVHPIDAQRFGVTSGGRARVCCGDRYIEAPVSVTDEMMPGVISLPHGWGHDLPGVEMRVAATRPGTSLNALLDDEHRDPLSGNAVLSGVPVSLSPCP
jgi:anaerobic selenocysteine-containing dehydrogenase